MAIWIRKAEFQKEDNKWLKGRMDQVKAENEVIDQQIKVLSRDMKRLREDNGKAREKYERAKVRVRAMKESKTTMESRLDILRKAAQINQNEYEELDKTVSKLQTDYIELKNRCEGL
ncbi:hypothetical protein COLO4_16046 [Corchorus olitorius]|uniref:Uncharacterized protein n=1 Tax=Corchorus olitorius TaxID=93759 RepID=A0A1R3JK11_9ROSI|nr:hypothetical protein COLO4_16046 [Corchorus olitorius]